MINTRCVTKQRVDILTNEYVVEDHVWTTEIQQNGQHEVNGVQVPTTLTLPTGHRASALNNDRDDGGG